MFRRLKIRRAARALHETHPYLSLPVARTRATRMVQRYPKATTQRVGEYLVHEERVRIMLAAMLENTVHKAPTEETS